MWFAFRGIIPPKEWYHDPNLEVEDGMTVATILALSGIPPPKEWVI